MGHYFENDNNLKSELRSIDYKINDTSFVLYTDNGVFSKEYVDFGSNLLLEEYLKISEENNRVLDLGCGYGIIGIAIAKIKKSIVDQVDVNKRALHLTKMNNEKNNLMNNVFISDVYENITDKYDIIITNPPIRAGKKVYFTMLTDACLHLKENGSLFFVIRKEQGAKSILKNLEEKYNVEILKKYKGYYIIKAQMR